MFILAKLLISNWGKYRGKETGRGGKENTLLTEWANQALFKGPDACMCGRYLFIPGFGAITA